MAIRAILVWKRWKIAWSRTRKALRTLNPKINRNWHTIHCQKLVSRGEDVSEVNILRSNFCEALEVCLPEDARDEELTALYRFKINACQIHTCKDSWEVCPASNLLDLDDISHSILSKEVNLNKLGLGVRIRSPLTARFGLHAVACTKNAFLGDEQSEVVPASDIFDPETSLKEESD